jgi:Na+/proline symporter
VESDWNIEAIGVFFAVLVATYIAAWKGRRDARDDAEVYIGQQRLNRWLVGLSAGAAANSGFVVTGAVGLGYSYGLHWLLLPLGWFLGDLVFWKFFPHRINGYGAHARATTLADIITYGLRIGRLHPLTLASSAIVVLCLGGYTMAQWVAGQKFLEGAFGMSGHSTLLIFAAVIIAYSALGRFRGSVYADTLQAVTRILGTLIALGTVCWVAARDPASVAEHIRGAGAGFLNLLGNGTAASTVGFVLGYAAAALGFGLAQPQVTTRYLAASSPREAQAARWIYMGYVQLTWATMTLFGVLLRGVMPNLPDPEKGLTLFVGATLPAVFVGLILGDIFGAIASTANSLLVAMAQAARDLFPGDHRRARIEWLALGLGLGTMLAAWGLEGWTTVFGLAITSVSFMAAGLAPAVAIKVLGWRHSAWSLTAAVFVGIGAALAWNVGGLSGVINESAVGIPVGFLTNFLFVRRPVSRPLPRPVLEEESV